MSHLTHSVNFMHLGILTTNLTMFTCLSFKCWIRSPWCWVELFSGIFPLHSGTLLLCSVTFLVWIINLNYSLLLMALSGSWEACNSVLLGLFCKYRLLTWWSFKVLFFLLKLLCIVKKCRRKGNENLSGKEGLQVPYIEVQLTSQDDRKVITEASEWERMRSKMPRKRSLHLSSLFAFNTMLLTQYKFIKHHS